MPATIKRIHQLIPEKVEKLYSEFPYEEFCEPVLKRKLRYMGIHENQMAYQECYDAASDGYMYSIHCCALHNYKHVVNYIKRMINIGITCGLVIANENRNLCRENGWKQIQLDAQEIKDRW